MTGSGDPGSVRQVSGCILLPADLQAAEAADVVIHVEDVSRADAPSVVIGEQHLRHVRLEPGGTLPFHVDVPSGLVDERMSYSLSVHVDLSGSGHIEVGDLITTQTFPVLTRGNPDRIDISVRKI